MHVWISNQSQIAMYMPVNILHLSDDVGWKWKKKRTALTSYLQIYSENKTPKF